MEISTNVAFEDFDKAVAKMLEIGYKVCFIGSFQSYLEMAFFKDFLEHHGLSAWIPDPNRKVDTLEEYQNLIFDTEKRIREADLVVAVSRPDGGFGDSTNYEIYIAKMVGKEIIYIVLEERGCRLFKEGEKK